MKYLLLLTILFIGNQLGLACTCLPQAKLKKELINDSTMIFTGRVVSIPGSDDQGWLSEVTLEVIDPIHNVLSREITILTDGLNSSCWMGFQIGQEWFIFADYYSNKPYTDFCGRSRKLDSTKGGKKAKKTLDRIKKWIK